MSPKFTLCVTIPVRGSSTPKIECTAITKEWIKFKTDILTNPELMKKIPVVLQKAIEKGLSKDSLEDIKSLVAISEQAGAIRNPKMQKEFTAFAKNSVKLYKLPKGFSISIE